MVRCIGGRKEERQKPQFSENAKSFPNTAFCPKGIILMRQATSTENFVCPSVCYDSNHLGSLCIVFIYPTTHLFKINVGFNSNKDNGKRVM